MKREDVERWVEENQIELALLEGMDSAIVGIADDGLESPKVVYSKRKILKALQDQGMNPDGTARDIGDLPLDDARHFRDSVLA